ncbi:bifunctional diaminopimelate epimerase/glutamate racemase [Chlamydia sp.]|uniref:bifunctional diaminopimelate epimerase/glutamate racemase n=1 Tax=Chlamydia sp. TaxID=35827 RepID=UPI0025C6D0E3|nr:bifunctional diaminopimelate epimerase/glutamate racemase [Chlamydia sp.]MBQ8498671.1 bifunctional diaminopimelate epimerase/glutamate racemase [Chlamydia sp.]
MGFSSLLTTCKYLLYSGAGNSFILGESRPSLQDILFLCQEEMVDGFLCVEPSTIADAKLTIFNSDGSVASMCGNGLRCAMAHVAQCFGLEDISIETDRGIYQGKFFSMKQVLVDMTLPDWKQAECKLTHVLPGMPETVFFIDTGVPHVVVFVPDVNKVPVQEWGSFLRYHEDFAPEGVNVDFIQRKQDDLLLVYTYERGCERETLSCGTGMLASALVVADTFSLEKDFSLSVCSRSRNVVKIFSSGGKVFLEGPVCLLNRSENFRWLEPKSKCQG